MISSVFLIGRFVLDKGRLKDMITALTYDPGRFDDLVHSFVNILESYSNNLNVCEFAAELLFRTVRLPLFF